MNNDLISIVVPIYNGKDYVHRCIDTIIAQTYKNIEVVIVNDGSTDDSGRICDEIAKKDKRIKVIHKKNGGLSTARNIGIENCSGKYIGFVDADDWIEKDMYSYLYSLINNSNADVAEIALSIEYNYTQINKPNKSIKVCTLAGKDILRQYLYTLLKVGDYSFCTCLFKAELFKNYKFREGKINTDLDDKYRVLERANRYTYSNLVKYYYFQNPSSLTRAGLKKRDFNIFDAADNLLKLTENEDEEFYQLASMKKARAYFSLLAKIAYFGFYDKEINQKETINYLTSELRKNYGLLMSAPIPVNRKIMISVLCLNYRLLKYPLIIYRFLLNR